MYLLTYMPSKDSDESVHWCILIKSFTGCFLDTNDAQFLHEDNEDSVQTMWMHRLIQVFVGHTCQKVHFHVIWNCINNSYKAD